MGEVIAAASVASSAAAAAAALLMMLAAMLLCHQPAVPAVAPTGDNFLRQNAVRRRL